jgi:hypothetical protein
MAAAPEITMSLLMEQLGQTEKEADKVMKAADKGKGKKLVAVLQSLLVSAWPTTFFFVFAGRGGGVRVVGVTCVCAVTAVRCRASWLAV